MLVQALHAASRASLPWAAATVLLVVVGYVGVGAALVGGTARRVPLRGACLAEVAAATCNRIVPAGMGRTLLRVRYLRCAGLNLEGATVALAAVTVAGATVHILGILVASLAAAQTRGALPLPGGHLLAVAGGIVLVVATVTAAVTWSPSRPTRRLRAALRRRRQEATAQLRLLARSPSAFAHLALGSVVTSLAYVTAFWAACHAVGVGVAFAPAALVYLAGTAVAGAAPVPGGVGPAEIALTAGLTAAGGAPATALAAVLVFRFASFWLSTVAGVGALAWMLRRGALAAPGARRDHRPARRPPRARVAPRAVLVGGAVAAATLIGVGTAAAASPDARLTPAGQPAPASTAPGVVVRPDGSGDDVEIR
jgi:uncharacterized membrane protein YbhN (UPF0104 family)